MSGAILEAGGVLAGKYRIERTIGEGGFGFVLEAEHLALKERVAIKILRPERATDPNIAGRFLREARSIARLRGEHVVRVLDVGVGPGDTPYIVMEHLRGTDLAQIVDRQGPLSTPLAVECIRQACAALAEAHALGIVHRDIKPSNLFLTSRADGSSCIKVLDFGIAKAPPASAAEMSITRTQDIVGTPLYMPPEQMRSGKIADPRIDVWALGVTLYELIAGRPAFNGESLSEICAMVCQDAPETIANLPPGLWSVIERCIEKNPERRFQDVSALAMALTPFRSNAISGAGFVALESESAPLSFSRSFTVAEKNVTVPLRVPTSTRRMGPWMGAVAGVLAFGLTFAGMSYAHRAQRATSTRAAVVEAPAPPLTIPVTALPNAPVTEAVPPPVAPVMFKPAKRKLPSKVARVEPAPGRS